MKQPPPWNIRNVILPLVLLVLLGLSALPRSVRGDDAPQPPPPAHETSPTKLETPPDLDKVPDVFLKDAPEGISDLAAMERHMVQLIPRVEESVVALRVGRAQGTGVIISSDGLIATAAHVVGSPGRIVSVVTTDGKEYPAKTLGRNQTLDAALIKLQSKRTDWPHASLAREPTQLGEWCLAIGHPAGYQPDRGLVVRLGRVILANRWFVQSDCELIGGDSGGPLFDMSGHVMAVSSRIGEDTSLNFHVPATAYTNDWDRLIASEDFRSHSGAFLGVSGDAVEEGLKITKVYRDSPAEAGGLQEGDIIVTFQNKPVTDIDDLTQRVGELMPGRRIRLDIVRDGQAKELRMRLGMRWD